jgi:hypothetical protein
MGAKGVAPFGSVRSVKAQIQAPRPKFDCSLHETGNARAFSSRESPHPKKTQPNLWSRNRRKFTESFAPSENHVGPRVHSRWIPPSRTVDSRSPAFAEDKFHGNDSGTGTTTGRE